jgi:hypothetical protein
MSVPLRNWLVVHPVTKAATQQSSAAIAALLEVIPKVRFVISLLQRGWVMELKKTMVLPVCEEKTRAEILHLRLQDAVSQKEEGFSRNGSRFQTASR